MDFSGEVIRSRQNRTVVDVCKLLDRKEREKTKCFRFDGIKLLEEAIKNDVALKLIILREDSRDRLCQIMEDRFGNAFLEKAERVLTVSNEVFDKISEEKSPEGVICVARYIDKFQKNATIYNSADFLHMSEEQIVLLESVRDPSNIGAVIRSAAAMGVHRLIVSSDCADFYHPKAIRASMGTLFNQRIDRVESLPQTVEALRGAGRRVFAATLDDRAVRLGEFALQKGDCVVIGNEGHGLSQETVTACDHSVIIPMSGRAESLNAAVAASVLMWEFSKQPTK